MSRHRRPTIDRNRSYQVQIANNLVSSLGIDGAIDACARNGWSGTLNVILMGDRSYR
jgi:hypothetical protein